MDKTTYHYIITNNVQLELSLEEASPAFELRIERGAIGPKNFVFDIESSNKELAVKNTKFVHNLTYDQTIAINEASEQLATQRNAEIVASKESWSSTLVLSGPGSISAPGSRDKIEFPLKIDRVSVLSTKIKSATKVNGGLVIKALDEAGVVNPQPESPISVPPNVIQVEPKVKKVKVALTGKYNLDFNAIFQLNFRGNVSQYIETELDTGNQKQNVEFIEFPQEFAIDTKVSLNGGARLVDTVGLEQGDIVSYFNKGENDNKILKKIQKWEYKQLNYFKENITKTYLNVSLYMNEKPEFKMIYRPEFKTITNVTKPEDVFERSKVVSQ